MSLVARFWNLLNTAVFTDSNEDEEALRSDEDDMGLFMSAPGPAPQSAPDLGPPAALAVEDQEEPAELTEATVNEAPALPLAEGESAGERAAGESVAEDQPPAQDEAAVAGGAPAEFHIAAADGGSQGAGDDLLAAFREGTHDSEYSALTKEIDDVPIQELLAEARELRAMLPAAPVTNEDAG
jgi:hypothetical protein